jgi:ATP-dependent RNA helicase UAP56/SUB2
MADDLEDYVEDLDDQAVENNEDTKKGYVGVHAVSFDDMQLKRELTRAITDCGFEHPSESAFRTSPRRLTHSRYVFEASGGIQRAQ